MASTHKFTKDKSLLGLEVAAREMLAYDIAGFFFFGEGR
jgi:hypothetical protein